MRVKANEINTIDNYEVLNVRNEVISNNIANSQTVGYKKLDAGFLDLYTDNFLFIIPKP